jgi:hypothetical protein
MVNTKVSNFNEQARYLAVEACALIEDRLGTFTSSPNSLNRHLSAGFLARCMALIRGMARLDQDDIDELGGILCRALLEDCLLGLYVLLGGDEAIRAVLGEYERNVRTLIERNEIEELTEGISDERTSSRISLEEVSRRLGPLLEAAGDRKADATGLYDAVYRTYSTFHVHGAGSAFRYMVMSEPKIWSIVTRPEPTTMTWSVHLTLGALYATYFARVAFPKWGYETAPFADLLARVAELADLNAPRSPVDRLDRSWS